MIRFEDFLKINPKTFDFSTCKSSSLENLHFFKPFKSSIYSDFQSKSPGFVSRKYRNFEPKVFSKCDEDNLSVGQCWRLLETRVVVQDPHTPRIYLGRGVSRLETSRLVSSHEYECHGYTFSFFIFYCGATISTQPIAFQIIRMSFIQ